MNENDLLERIHQAMWDGDTDTLREIAWCGCCCDEHFFDSCPARIWGGCRGQSSLTRADIQKWADHYGMTVSQFYGADD